MREASRLSQSYIIAAPSADDCDAQAARLAARAVCSGAEPKPCGKCRDCRKAAAGIHPDIIDVRRMTDDKGRPKREIMVDQVRAMAADADALCLCGKLVDKFGDNGVVSVVIGRKNGTALDIDLWLMSCRVLKRDMEFAMLDRLVERCREVGVETINGYYYPTAKNKMVSDLFGRFGFTMTEEHEDGSTVWQLRVADYKPQNHVIEVFGNDHAEA